MSSPMKTRQGSRGGEETDFWPEDRPGNGRAALSIGLGVLGVVVVVAAVLYFFVFGSGGEQESTTGGEVTGVQPTVWVGTGADAGTAKLNLRANDKRALNPGEVFTNEVKTVSHGKYVFTLVGSQLSSDCIAATWGQRLQADLQKYGCTQVVRGAYLSKDKRHAGQFVAVNLDRLEGAEQIVRDLDPQAGAGFVRALDAPGVSKFGEGFSAAYGQSYGHYAIVSWVQRNGGGRPDSMNELLDASVAIEGANDFVWQRLVLAGG